MHGLTLFARLKEEQIQIVAAMEKIAQEKESVQEER